MQHKSAYFWGVLNRFLPSLISILSTMILARFLTPEDFGVIGVVSIIFFVARTLIDSGLGGSLINEKNATEIDFSTINVFNLGMGIFLYGVLCLSSGYIEAYFEIPDLRYVVILLGLTLVIGPFGLVPGIILQKRLAFLTICKISILSIILATIISIVMAYFDMGVYALVANQVLQSLFMAMLNIYYCKYRVSFKFCFNSLKRLLNFGLFTALSSIVDSIYENLLTILTGKYLSVQQAGYMSQAKRVEEAFSISLTSAISTVSFPILSAFKTDNNLFKKECLSVYRTIMLLAVPCLVIIAIFSREIIVLMFGTQWLGASYYLKMLAIAGIFLVMETLIRIFIKSHGDADKLFAITIIKRIVGIGLIIALLSISGELMIIGYIVSSFIAFLINAVLFCHLTQEKFYTLMTRTLIYLLPSLLVWLIDYVLISIFDISLFLQIAIVGCMFLLYGVIVLRILGIKPMAYLQTLKKR